MLLSILAVSLGAAAGALARWALGLSLNSLFPAMPPGTLVANLIGGYLVGIALALFASNPQWSPAWRLLAVTGFLGGLTTFSTFSAEVSQLIQQQRLLLAGATIATHVVGSITLTLLGIATVAILRRL